MKLFLTIIAVITAMVFCSEASAQKIHIQSGHHHRGIQHRPNIHIDIGGFHFSSGQYQHYPNLYNYRYQQWLYQQQLQRQQYHYYQQYNYQMYHQHPHYRLWR